MWLSNDSAQTAETTSINPWNMEQQNRWANGGMQFSGFTDCDERIRAIIPPAFRNGNAKVVWQDPKSLEANVNEALGITNCYGTSNTQFAEQNGFNVSIHNPYGNPTNGWNQTEGGRPNPWEYNTATSTPLLNGFTTPALGGNVVQPKVWCGPEDQWDNPSKRNLSFACGPPPAFHNPVNNTWQRNGFRNFPPPTARFTSSTPYDGKMMNAPAVQSSGMPSAVGAPSQRSRLQSLWNVGLSANNVMPGMCVPPPNRDYNMINSSEQLMATNGMNPMKCGMPKNQYGPPFVNCLSSQVPLGAVTSAKTTNSFMGEDSMWQDPNHELRKWQRDTGTSIWGDAEKQTGEIRHWLPPFEDQDGLNNELDPKRKKLLSMGWGDPVSLTSSKSPISTSSGVSSVCQPANWARKFSQPTPPTTNVLFDSSALNKALSSQALNKISSVLGQDELASLVAAVKLNSVTNGDGPLVNNTTFTTTLGGIGEQLEGDIRDGYAAMKLGVPDVRGKNRDGIVGNGLAALSEAATATMPRFGDSILDVTTCLDQPKSLFSF